MQKIQPENPHAILYALGLLFAILAFFFAVFALYILPFVLFQSVNYNVPLFVVQLHQWFIQRHDLTGWLLVMAVFIPFGLAAGLFGYLARWINLHIEAEEDAMKSTEVVFDVEAARVRTYRLMVKVSLTGVGMLLAFLLIEYSLLR
jgi:hypothetical protein